MNKTKTILAIAGGVSGVAVLATAFLAWRAYSAKAVALEGDDEEGVAGLESVISKAQSLSRKEVYPCAQNVVAVKSNQTVVADWQAEAKKLVSRGDRVFEKTTPAAFKAFIVADARRLQSLPGGAGGHIARTDFPFGPFKEYIFDGKLPTEDGLVVLQRKWDDIASIVEILSGSGVAELTDVSFVEIGEKGTENGPKNQKGKKQKKPIKKGQKAAASKAPVTFRYAVAFTARPAAFVRAVNALATCERFMTVEDFGFHRATDVLAESLGGDEKKGDAAAAASGGRRGRRRAAVASEKPEEEHSPRKGVVSDPATDDPLVVTLSVVVHDFRSLEDEASEEAK